MIEFEITYTSRVKIFANSLEEASVKMNEMYPGSAVTPISFYSSEDGKNEVIGRCEYSGLAIFEGDDYSCDEDGIMWLNI